MQSGPREEASPAPAMRTRFAFPSSRTFIACSMRPLPPVITTTASVRRPAFADRPSVTAKKMKPSA